MANLQLHLIIVLMILPPAEERVHILIPEQKIRKNEVHWRHYIAHKPESLHVELYLHIQGEQTTGSVSLCIGDDMKRCYNTTHEPVYETQKFHLSKDILMNPGDKLRINFSGPEGADIPPYPKSQIVITAADSQAKSRNIMTTADSQAPSGTIRTTVNSQPKYHPSLSFIFTLFFCFCVLFFVS